MPRQSPAPSVSGSIHSIVQSDSARRRRIRPWRVCACKRSERNPLAAVLSLLSSALIAAALLDEKWISLTGGHCPLKYLGAPLFYRSATFKRSVQDEDHPHIFYIIGSHRKYVDCVNPAIANVFYGLIGISFVTLATSMVAFVLDALGPRHGFAKWLRRNVLFSVCTVVLCSVVVGLTYWAASLVEDLQRRSSTSKSLVRVSFGEAFYLIAVSGVLSVSAVAVSLLKTLRRIRRKRGDRVALLNHMATNPVDPLPADLAAETERQRIRIFENYLMAVTGEQQESQTSSLAAATAPPSLLLPPPPPYSP